MPIPEPEAALRSFVAPLPLDRQRAAWRSAASVRWQAYQDALDRDDHIAARRHARLVFANGMLQIEELGSTNGTSVNAETASPGRPQRLKSGAKLKIGEIDWIF